MRGYTFEARSKQARDELFEMLFKGVKEVEAFALRDIILNRWEREGMYYAGLVIDDGVSSNVMLVFDNKNKDEDRKPIVRFICDFGFNDISISNDINISITWRPDGLNRYKIIKLNHDKIIDMIKSGCSAEEIGKTFEIPLTEEECRKLGEKG